MVLLCSGGGLLVAGVGRGAVVAGDDGVAAVLGALDAPAAADDERVVAVACAADGSLVVAASAAKALRCWTRAAGGAWAAAGTAALPRRPSAVAVADSAAESAALCCCAGELVAYRLPDLGRSGVALGHTSSVLTAVAAGGGLVLTGDRNEKVRVSEFPRCAVIDAYLLGHTAYVAGVALFGAGRAATVGGDGALRVWDARSGACDAVRRPALDDAMVDVPLDAPPPGEPATCVAARDGAVAVGLRDAPAVFVYDATADAFAAAPSALPLPGAPVDVAFHGPALLVLVTDGVLREFRRGAAGWAAADAGPAAAAVAAAAARPGLGAVAGSGFFGALHRDHAFGGPADGAPDAILRKHALDTKFDADKFAGCGAKKSRA